MAGSLRDQLIGAWKLVSYQEMPADGSEPFEPLGPEPRGIIVYTRDGYVSAQGRISWLQPWQQPLLTRLLGGFGD